jgi:hypothetical protein
VSFERLDLDMNFGVRGTALRFTAWEDSQAWIDLRQHKRNIGWTFKLELRPELWDLDGPEIVRRVEKTVSLLHVAVSTLDPEEKDRIKALWSSSRRSSSSKKKRRK